MLFVADLCVRFKDRMNDCVVEKFNKLAQTGTLEEYFDEFEQLKNL